MLEYRPPLVALELPEFLADSEKQRLLVTPMTGADVERFIAELYRTPPDVVVAAKEISGD